MKQFVCRPRDTEGQVLSMVIAEVKALNDAGEAARVKVEKYHRPKTPPQLRTVWMWHGEVAAALNEAGYLSGYSVKWSKDDVHEFIFKPKFMPLASKVLPDGRELSRTKGLSDRETTVKDVTDAMEQYLAWIFDRGIEVTIPDEHEHIAERVVGVR